jgi:hypothetical protein
MLPVWRSVEIVSGVKPAFISGTAVDHRKLVPPWPTSKETPRFRPSIIAALGALLRYPARLDSRRTCACRCRRHEVSGEEVLDLGMIMACRFYRTSRLATLCALKRCAPRHRTRGVERVWRAAAGAGRVRALLPDRGMRINMSSTLCATAGLVLGLALPARTQTSGTQANELITVNGCLTARPDGQSYALTPVKAPQVGDAIAKSASDVKPTFTYELVGDADQFRPHVGRLVTANGRVDTSAKKSEDVDKEQKAAPPATTRDAKPQVKVEERARIEVRRLVVSSLTSEGKACPATPKS